MQGGGGRMNSPAIKNPPYLDFANHILYMGGNNKALLESWVYFLTKSHTFAVSGSYGLATEQRFSKPVKYEAQITGVRNVEALRWVERNFNPKRHPPYHPVKVWKRPDPTPKRREPVWIVRVGLDE